MNIVLVGEFSPPFDALTIYNLALVEKHRAAGDEVTVVDMAQLQEAEGSHFVAYLKRLFQASRSAEQIHYLTHGYDRTSIFYLFFALLIGRLSGCLLNLTLHAELFAFFGPLRSAHVGKPLLRFCFRAVNVIYCGNEVVAETVVALGGDDTKCVIQPPRIPWPHKPELDPELSAFLESHTSTVVMFASPKCSFLCSEAVSMVRRWYGRSLRNPGFIIVSQEGEDASLVEGIHPDEGLVWQGGNLEQVTYLLSRASVVIRPLESMGQLFVPDYAFMIERPRRVGDYFDTGLGATIIRKGKGLSGRYESQSLDAMPTPLVQRITDVILTTGQKKRALLMGAFSSLAGEETTFNKAFCLELEQAEVVVETIKMPQNNFDSEETGSFFSFLGNIDRLLKNNDFILYSTQGFTRPSLLLLLGCTVLGKLRGKKVYVLFHRDAFSFFSKLRSRNAGLPLLFTSFTLAEGIMAMDEDGYRAALQYKNAPEKFHIVQPDLSLLRTTAKVFADEPVGPTTQAKMDGSFSTTLADGLAAQQETLGSTTQLQIRPLQCNGELIAYKQAALIESIHHQDDELDSAGVIVIPKENPRNIEGLFGG